MILTLPHAQDVPFLRGNKEFFGEGVKRGARYVDPPTMGVFGGLGQKNYGKKTRGNVRRKVFFPRGREKGAPGPIATQIGESFLESQKKSKFNIGGK